MNNTQYCSYRFYWSLFKVQIWCLMLVHKLILLCAHYSALS